MNKNSNEININLKNSIIFFMGYFNAAYVYHLEFFAK